MVCGDCCKWPHHPACLTRKDRTIWIMLKSLIFLSLTGLLIGVTYQTWWRPQRDPDPDFPALNELEYGIRWFDKGLVSNPNKPNSLLFSLVITLTNFKTI